MVWPKTKMSAGCTPFLEAVSDHLFLAHLGVQDSVPWGCRIEAPVSLLVVCSQFVEVACIPWLVGSPSIFKASKEGSSPPHMTAFNSPLLPPCTFKDLCDKMIPGHFPV